jgi:hypothetical protein
MLPAAPHPTVGALPLREGMSFHAWLEVGRRIARVANTSAWAVGDWLLFGERAYGERYRTALAATDLDYQTLRNYAWVARRFPLSRRRDTVSFQHHAELASLPEAEQDLWLRRTELNGWSRNELRRQLAGARAPRPAGGARPRGADERRGGARAALAPRRRPREPDTPAVAARRGGRGGRGARFTVIVSLSAFAVTRRAV